MSRLVFLARHAQTSRPGPNRYTGRDDVPLDEVGEQQAVHLAAWAAQRQLSGVVSSPLRRARGTAAPVAERLGLPVQVDQRLVEVGFGVAEGHTMAELREQIPDAVAAFERDPVGHHWPGGEDPRLATERALAALHDVAAGGSQNGPVLLVAHSTLIRLVVCAVTGIDLREYRRLLPRVEPTGLTCLRVAAAGEMAVLAFNSPPVTGGLPPGWQLP